MPLKIVKYRRCAAAMYASGRNPLVRNSDSRSMVRAPTCAIVVGQVAREMGQEVPGVEPHLGHRLGIFGAEVRGAQVLPHGSRPITSW